MSNRDLRTQSYGGDVALDCWVCGRGAGRVVPAGQLAVEDAGGR